jgi:LDH2 family malate/lactate/ureidoglycolate dehydrogenase
MPRIKAEELEVIARSLFVAAGTPENEAEIVARHCIAANLAGHDSHGIIRVPDYIERIKKGHIVPGAPWTITRETDSTTVVDGHWGFGYVATERAMKLTIDKARKHGVAAATVARQGHIGRLASYTLMAAEQNMIGLITADSGRSPKQVVPFGGRAPRLGTNPLSVAVPSTLEGPLFIDFATSAVAGGKISLAAARNEEIPSGWVIDSDGRPTTDPKKHKQGGALLPLGGSEGYKGYGLAVIVEILCGLLTGLGFGVEPTGKHNDGCFLAVFSVDAFMPLTQFKQEVTDFAKYLNDTPPAEGSKGVLYPGEIEFQAERDRRKNGVMIEDGTWKKLRDLADGYGLQDRLKMQ